MYFPPPMFQKIAILGSLKKNEYFNPLNMVLRSLNMVLIPLYCDIKITLI